MSKFDIEIIYFHPTAPFLGQVRELCPHCPHKQQLYEGRMKGERFRDSPKNKILNLPAKQQFTTMDFANGSEVDSSPYSMNDEVDDDSRVDSSPNGDMDEDSRVDSSLESDIDDLEMDFIIQEDGISMSNLDIEVTLAYR